MKHLKLFNVLISALLISACAAQSTPVTTTPADSTAMNEQNGSEPNQAQINATGTVRFQEIEGGFWGIVADDGRKFDPMDLDEKFQKEGLRVKFTATPDNDRMSTHMWGTIIILSYIEAVK